jgi:hypothetical protein
VSVAWFQPFGVRCRQIICAGPGLVSGSGAYATSGDVWVDAQHLVLWPGSRRELRIPRWRLRAGFRIPRPASVVIMLVGGARLTLVPEQGFPDILPALGLAEEGQILQMSLQRRSDVTILGIFIGLYSLVVTGVLAAVVRSAFPLLLSVALSLLVIWVLGRRRVVVGADGLLVHNGLRERFISFSEVERVDDLTVWLRSGKRISVSISGNPADRGAVVQRLKDAFERYVQRGAEVDARLARNGRDIGQWFTELKHQALAGSSFRTANLPQEQLERVLSSAASGIEQRIGAAVALSALGPEQVERVRIAAQGSVNERFRVALEAAAEGREEEAVYEAALVEDRRAS